MGNTPIMKTNSFQQGLRGFSASKWVHKQWFPPLVIFILLLVSWVLVIEIFNVPQYLLPSPGSILREMVQSFEVFVRNGAVTLLSAILGYIIGGTLGLLLGTLLSLSKFMERGLLPFIVGSTTVPIVAFAPIVVVYVGAGIQSKIVVAAIVSFFPLCLYTLKGLLSTDLTQRDLFYSLAASRRHVFFKLQVPTALPYIMTAMKQTSTVAVVSAIVAEYIQANVGFGFLILQSSYVMNIPRMWTSVLYSSMMAMVFYFIIVIIERKVVPWHESMVEDKH